MLLRKHLLSEHALDLSVIITKQGIPPSIGANINMWVASTSGAHMEPLSRRNNAIDIDANKTINAVFIIVITQRTSQTEK